MSLETFDCGCQFQQTAINRRQQEIKVSLCDRHLDDPVFQKVIRLFVVDKALLADVELSPDITGGVIGD